MTTDQFLKFRRTQIAHMRPWVPGESMADISISSEDVKAGSPKAGDMVARNPKNFSDRWLVAAQYFADNFEPGDAAPVGVTVLASEAIKRGQEAIGYATSQQGWDADYACAHAEVVFLSEPQK